MLFSRLLPLLALAATLAAQSRPPVVFVRGYDFDWLFGSCSPSQPADTFGTLPASLTAQGVQVLWFDNCAEAERRSVSIAALGQLFGQFLTRSGVSQVDVVAHSMGGLIVRAYLAGMQPGTGGAAPTFNPPAATRIRRAIFIATPHFGFEEIAAGGSDLQLSEMRQGSSFLYELARWNQGTDDLRGVETVAIAGNSGTGNAPLAGNTDGIVSTNSAALNSFGLPSSRTRVLPNCHTGILANFGLCTGIGIATSPEALTIIRSFLTGTNEWQTTGTTFQPSTGGVFVTARDAADRPVATTRVTFDAAGTALTQGSGASFRNFLPPGNYPFTAQAANSSIQATAPITAGTFNAVLLKTPPLIGAVIPSAGLVDARVVAPGQLISLYGSGLAEGTAQTTTLSPLPTRLSDATLTLGTTELGLLIASAGQVNAYLPPTTPTGLANLTLRNTRGQHTTTLLVAPAAFTFFTRNGSGSGPALAQHADGTLITDDSPARPGEVIILYGTGLGATRNIDGIDYAQNAPEVTVGGARAELLFAGRTPGFIGLDQLNLRIPAGATGNAPMTAISVGRTSNAVTIPVRAN